MQQALQQADDVFEKLVENSNFRQVITAYRVGFTKTEEYNKENEEFREAYKKAKNFREDMSWAAEMIDATLAMGLLVGIGILTSDDKITIGTFVATMTTVNNFGSTMAHIFDEIFSFFQGFASVLQVAQVLNAETRRVELLRAKTRRAALVQTYREEHGQSAFDQPRLMVNEVQYQYHPEQVVTSVPYHFDLDSGALYAVRSDLGVGKATFFKLLARLFLAKSWGMPTANAEGWIESEGSVGKVSGETRL